MEELTRGLYGGIDLHSNNHVLTIIDEQDRRVHERRLANDLSLTRRVLDPCRSELVAVATESTFNWYWLVDGLMESGDEVRLVNPAAVKHYEELKRTDDQHDAFWLAHLLRLGILPTGYIYPKGQRGLRNLTRQRTRLVQHRSSHLTPAQNQIWRSTGVKVPASLRSGQGLRSGPRIVHQARETECQLPDKAHERARRA